MGEPATDDGLSDDGSNAGPSDDGSNDGIEAWRRYDVAIDIDSPVDSRAIVLRLVPAGARVLELGCSAGLMTRVMHERGHEVVGIEYDPDAAAHAEPFTERLLVGDLDGPDVWDELVAHRDDGYDVILAADVLEHLRDPDRCLARALDHLRPGGTVILSIPNAGHADVRLGLLDGRFEYQESGLLDRTHIHLFTYGSLCRLVETAGLVPVEWHRCVRGVGDTEVPVDPGLLEFGRRVFAGDPDAFTYQWILVCRRAGDAEAVADPALRGPTASEASQELLRMADEPPLPPPPPERVAVVDDVRRVAGGLRRRAGRAATAARARLRAERHREH